MKTFAVAAGAALVAVVCGSATNTGQAAKIKRPAVFAHQGAEDERPPNTVASFMRAAESAKTCGDTYGLPSRYLSEQLVDYYHASDLKVATWTSDSEAEDNEAVWAKLTKWGVDVITTKHPARLLVWQAKNCAKQK